MRHAIKTPIRLAVFIPLIIACGCVLNDPYRTSEKGKNIFYTTFEEPPRHLDPARSYSEDEYGFIAQVYEPPLQYHYLRRPYELIPLTAEGVPVPVYLDASGRALPQDVAAGKVHRAIYEIRIKRGIMYQDHPAFAKGPDQRPLYRNMRDADLDGIYGVMDFPVKGTRELKADDYIYQIKRLADPRLESPILSILEKYVLGLKEYSDLLRREIEEERLERTAAGPAFGGRGDGRERPATPDYGAHDLPGVEKVDDYTFRVILKTKYPQFLYWLAMPFFSPMPPEADSFYGQAALVRRNITLDRYPIGTGPYAFEVYNPNMEIVLARNPNFRKEPYPEDGEDGDREAGVLADSGEALPFIERIVFKLEKEAIPRWNKFLQGYYDSSGIASESFDQAVSISAAGRAEPTEEMTERGVRLLTSVRPSTYYSGFNMLDDVVGGYSTEGRKLRQAISIALDYEEYIEVFNNGRGIAASSPLPPGIFGFLTGEDGVNPYVYDWDARRNAARRKPMEYARRLMAEAGYPGGSDREGRPLVITFDNPWTGADATPMINWYMKKFRLLGIQLENRTTDYNRFQEKMLSGNFQFFSWGWNADYPDPENFFFLLAGAGGKVEHQGENVSNYRDPEFDRLFAMMENMDNTPERLRVIKEMTRIIQRDSPWVWGYHPVAFGLYHGWTGNIKPNPMANNSMKYVKVDPVRREGLREGWNRANLRPVAVAAAVVAMVSLPAIISVVRKGRRGARRA
jgi:ABC-type transport system substrate-binding protein